MGPGILAEHLLPQDAHPSPDRPRAVMGLQAWQGARASPATITTATLPACQSAVTVAGSPDARARHGPPGDQGPAGCGASVRPVLIVNPRSDTAFVEAADTAAQQVATAPELQVRLRAAYPHTIVRPRELSSEPVTVWYVYRDGRWTPEPPR